MSYIYILFAVLGLWAECSSKIDTRNVFKKVGFCLIILGCLVELAGHLNSLIELGAFSYILADLYKKWKLKEI